MKSAEWNVWNRGHRHLDTIHHEHVTRRRSNRRRLILSKLTCTMADRLGVIRTAVSSARELEERVYCALFRRYFSESAEDLVARWRGSHVEECSDDQTGARVQDI